MAPKDLIASAERLGAEPAPRGVLPPGALHVGPGKAVALLMVLADIAGLLLAFALGAWAADLTRELLTGVSEINRGFFGPRTDVLPVLVFLMVGVFGFGGLYKRDGWEAEEIKRLVAAIALIALFDAALAYVTKAHFSRFWFFYAWPLAMMLIISLRMSLRAIPFVERLMTTHMVLLGSGIDREDFSYQLRESRSGPVQVIEDQPLGALSALSTGDLETWLDGAAARAGIQPKKLQTVIVPSTDEHQTAQALSDRLSTLRRPFFVAVSYDGLARRGVSLHKIVGSDMVLAGVVPEALPFIDRAIKRALDLLLTGLGTLIISPLLALIALALLLEGGPVFFTQMRVGKDRKRFRCLKFRSMRPDAEARLQKLLAEDADARAEWETHQKLTNDPRITRVGHILRATSLDELPQIFNVLAGHMSLVGPRPIIAPEVPGYDGDKAYYESPEFRHYAKCVPGITGLWQVSGRHRTTHEERVRLDRWYARNWSIWLDLAILFKTFRAVVGRSGG